MSYAAQTSGALRVMKAKGVPLVMKRTSASAHDPVEQTSTGVGNTEQPIQAVVLPAADGVFGDAMFRTQSLVRRDQRKLLVAGKAPDGAALDFEPMSGYTIEFENAPWTINAVARLAPDGGDPILFTVEVSR